MWILATKVENTQNTIHKIKTGKRAKGRRAKFQGGGGKKIQGGGGVEGGTLVGKGKERGRGKHDQVLGWGNRTENLRTSKEWKEASLVGRT